MKTSGAFRILTDNYVTDDSGTGVVHSAPAFGEVSIKMLDTAATIAYCVRKVNQLMRVEQF